MFQIPQIDNGKSPEEILNFRHIRPLPTDTPYGNLLLKSLDIVRRLDKVNVEIRRVFASYVHPCEADSHDLGNDLLKHQFYQEQVVYWLRRTADELVSLAFVIDERRRIGSWPRRIEIDCIGSLLARLDKHTAPDELENLFKPHGHFLSALNDVSNAFKHSFINTDFTTIGPEHPVVFALSLERNRLSNTPKFYQVPFADIVHAFSSLYGQASSTISRWAN